MNLASMVQLEGKSKPQSAKSADNKSMGLDEAVESGCCKG